MTMTVKTAPAPERSSSRFADFIRHASAGEKKRVYSAVLQGATERQLRILKGQKKPA